MNNELGIRKSTSPLYPSPGLGRGGRGRAIIHDSRFLILILLFGFVAGLILRDIIPKQEAAAKVVTIQSRNLEFQVATTAKTIGEVLGEQGYLSHNSPQPSLILREGVPPLKVRGGEGELLVNGMTIEVTKPLNVTLIDAGNEKSFTSQAVTVGDLLNEQKIGLAATDQVKPGLESYLGEGLWIVIDRIVDLEVVEQHEIPYEVRLEYDPQSYYGREEVVSAGVVGEKEQKFLITYKNGVEVRRNLLAQTVIQKPVIEFRKFGTKIEIQEVTEGRASWYAYKKCVCAAHPFYDKGRYVRVTSLTTGKSLIVQINDRGPDLAVHPDRVIDLDSVAFKELAPLGSGTIGVRVELLQN